MGSCSQLLIVLVVGCVIFWYFKSASTSATGQGIVSAEHKLDESQNTVDMNPAKISSTSKKKPKKQKSKSNTKPTKSTIYEWNDLPSIPMPNSTKIEFNSSLVNNFIMYIKQVIRSKKDIVGLHRFYTEQNLSFAKSMYLSSNLSSNTTALKTLSSLSQDTTVPRTANPVSGVPSVAWARDWYKENYLVPKAGYATNFADLAKQVSKINSFVKSSGGVLNAIRYHTYTSHCKLIVSLGNASVVPLPIILTFKLNPDVGHYSSDTPGKTCIRYNSRDETGACKEVIDMAAYLKRCKHTIDDLKRVIDNPKLLLFVTNQQHSFEHSKMFSLPLGVTSVVAAKISLLLTEMKSGTERPVMLALSNYQGYYSEKVAAFYNRYYHIKASSEYDKRNRIEENNLIDYLEKLSLSKFTLCPPGEQGYDSYRIWEALLMGSIPIVEANPLGPGIEKAFSLLPVLVVPDLLKLPLQHLADAYACFVHNVDKWRFDYLTQYHWDEMLLLALKNGHIEHIIKDHPTANPYCNYKLYMTTGRWSS